MEDLDNELQIKYDLFLRWLQLHEKADMSETPLLCLEDSDNFQDTIEDEDEKDIFLEPMEPVLDEKVENRKECDRVDKENNIFLNFSLNQKPSVHEILGFPEVDPTKKLYSEVECKEPIFEETQFYSKPLSHNKGKAPEHPSFSPDTQPPPLPRRKHENTSISPMVPLTNPEKPKQKKGLKAYLTKSDDIEPSSNSSDDFGKETQI